jgi:DNA-binding NtrC family response regulator
VLAVLEPTAHADAHVLITGERGAGKEVVARWIHGESPRASRPLVALRAESARGCSPADDLFGHSNGSARQYGHGEHGHLPSCLELAHQGTLFLDGVAGLGLDAQRRLAQVLESGACPERGFASGLDLRVILALTDEPDESVRGGRLTAELLAALEPSRVHVPPLRERREDVPVLAMAVLAEMAERYAKPVTSFEPDAVRLMLDYTWPGNVRELEHAVEHGVLLSRDDGVCADDLGIHLDGRPTFDSMTLSAVERVLIQKALVRHAGNVSRAAKTLGLSRSALYRRLHRHGL